MNEGQDTMLHQLASDGAETIFATRALLPDGWAKDVTLRLAAGRIGAIQKDATPPAGCTRVSTLLPGVSNLHSHAFQRGMAGLTERRGAGPDSFWTWRACMYRFVHALTPDSLRAIAELAYIEMLEAGMTRVGEFHYVHHAQGGAAYEDPAEMSAQLLEAARCTGIQMTLLPVYYARSDFAATSAAPEQARFACERERYLALVAAARKHAQGLAGSVVGCAPHSLRAASVEDIRAIAKDHPKSVMHIHIAEQMREVEACRAHHGRRPVEHLLGEVEVDSRWCLVHATHMTPQERQAVAQARAVVGLCPITEANLGDGLLDVDHLMAEGGLWGIGSDSNVRIDMAEELRLLEYNHRLMRQGRNVLAPGDNSSTGRSLYTRAVQAGGQALGAPSDIAVGAWADCVGLAAEHPGLVGRAGDDALDSFIFACGSAAIDAVWVRGEQVVERGRHKHRTQVQAQYARVMQKLLSV